MADLICRFIKTKDPIADGIAWWTNSEWDHFEFGTPDETWLGARAEGGVQERFATYCTPIRERRYARTVTDEQLSLIMSRARAKVGTKYDFMDIAGLLLHNRWLSLHPTDKEICSMYGTEMLLSIYQARDLLNVLPNFTPLITPEMLHLSPLWVESDLCKCIYSLGV